jgi:hypothetical protein
MYRCHITIFIPSSSVHDETSTEISSSMTVGEGISTYNIPRKPKTSSLGRLAARKHRPSSRPRTDFNMYRVYMGIARQCAVCDRY